MVEYNTIILGSGISGMSCAIYLKRAGIRTLIIENNVPGGQLNRIGTIENYPGYLSVQGPDLALELFGQVNEYQVDYEYGEVISIDYEKKIVQVENKKFWYHHLVIATGRREKRLGLEHEEELIGCGISFCATCDGALFRNQDVIVVGGGNSAVSEAIYLAQICRKVVLIYRNQVLRSEEILKSRLAKISNIQVLYNSTIQSYITLDGKVSGVCLEDGTKIDASCVFLAIGHIPNSELFDGEKENGYIIVDSHYRTSQPFVYACGDVIKKELYQLITASSEGVLVASDIIKNNIE